MVEPAVENQQISLFDEALCESKVKSYQDLNNENVVENLFAEYQKAFVKKVAPKKSESDSGQMSIFDYFANDDEKETNDGTASDHKMTQTGMGTDAVDTSFTVHQGMLHYRLIYRSHLAVRMYCHMQNKSLSRKLKS